MNISIYNGSKEPLIKLFSDCFNGDVKTAKRFFSMRSVTVAAENDGGEIVGMLNLVPVFTEDCLGFYVYGACAAESARGEAVLDELLDAAEREAELRGCHFICLIPESEELADGYRRRGYCTEITCYGSRISHAETIFSLSAFTAFANEIADRDAKNVGPGLLKPLCGCRMSGKYKFDNYMGEV